MDELSLDNILTGEDFDTLFADNETQEPQPEQKEEQQENKLETTEVDTDILFEPESVGSEDNKDKEDTPSDESGNPSKFFSSIAKAFAEEGIFPDLDEDQINKVSNAEDFRQLIEERIKSELDERQRRIDEALSYGIEPNTIKSYENTINYLNSITEANLADESTQGEKLRRTIIMQDYLNRGYSQERAAKAVEKSIKNGDDIEDAKEALAGNKEFFKGQYDNLIKEAKALEEKEVQERKKLAEQLKNSILTDKKFFGDLDLDKATRQRIFENIAKPVYTDPKTGEAFTAIQKYELENRTDFLKNLGLVFTLTDGFKNLDKLVDRKVKKEVKRGLRDLETTLNSTSRNSDGSLRFVSGVDSESFIGRGWKLDI